jgi:hypothetical protein
MDVVFAKEKFQDVADEARVLWLLHWRETEAYREKEGVSPDIEEGLRLEKGGQIAVYTARHNGSLVGHLAFLLYQSRHTGKTNAVEEYFYLLPQFRMGFTAIRLLRFATNDLKESGCSGIVMTSKLTHDISPLLKRAGFTPVSTVFYKGV